MIELHAIAPAPERTPLRRDDDGVSSSAFWPRAIGAALSPELRLLDGVKLDVRARVTPSPRGAKDAGAAPWYTAT